MDRLLYQRELCTYPCFMCSAQEKINLTYHHWEAWATAKNRALIDKKTKKVTQAIMQGSLELHGTEGRRQGAHVVLNTQLDNLTQKQTNSRRRSDAIGRGHRKASSGLGGHGAEGCEEFMSSSSFTEVGGVLRCEWGWIISGQAANAGSNADWSKAQRPRKTREGGGEGR